MCVDNVGALHCYTFSQPYSVCWRAALASFVTHSGIIGNTFHAVRAFVLNAARSLSDSFLHSTAASLNVLPSPRDNTSPRNMLYLQVCAHHAYA